MWLSAPLSTYISLFIFICILFSSIHDAWIPSHLPRVPWPVAVVSVRSSDSRPPLIVRFAGDRSCDRQRDGTTYRRHPKPNNQRQRKILPDNSEPRAASAPAGRNGWAPANDHRRHAGFTARPGPAVDEKLYTVIATYGSVIIIRLVTLGLYAGTKTTTANNLSTVKSSGTCRPTIYLCRHQ